MKTFQISLLAIALLAFAPLLHAQDDAKRTAAVEEMLTAMHCDELMTKLMAIQRDNTIKLVESRMPKNFPPDTVKKIDDAVTSSVDEMFKQLSWESLKPDFVKIYAAAYTEKEIKDLTAFYKSPIGQKLVDKMPEIQQKTADLIHDRIVTLMPAMQNSIRQAIQKSNDGGGAPSAPSTPAAPTPQPQQ